ncbi:autoimmune regulator [Calonectris borealis]|uniref:autoimmune regulator n=1 Tax=Calonectris borealis TaxID=1323832 RepID=UPI003F4C1905
MFAEFFWCQRFPAARRRWFAGSQDKYSNFPPLSRRYFPHAPAAEFLDERSSMAGPAGEGDLRRLLKLHRTEIAMAVDDVFPLLHGLADHDVVPEHVFKETLSRTEREGSHRAFHALLTWLLGCDAAAVRDFWAVLFKDYNLERYTRLRPLRGAFPREVELGRQRRGRRLSPSPTVPAPHRPQGKRKAPEERDGARAAQPSPRHVASPGPLAKAKTVKKPEGADAPRTPRAGALQAVAASVQRAVAVAGSEVPITRGAVEGILIKHVLEPGRCSPAQPSSCPVWPPNSEAAPSQGGGGEGAPPELLLASLAGSSKMGTKARDEPYAPAACEEPGARSRSRSQKPPARSKASQSSGEPRLHPQGRLPVPAMHSQDLAPHQENEDECAACGDGGELICCDGCPRAFHLACLVPPLPCVPSGTWRCGSCVVSAAEPGRLREADMAAERPPEIPGEEACGTRRGGGDGSVCNRCFTRIPTSRHCPAPGRDPGVLVLCTSCAGTTDTGSMESTAAAGDHPLQAAKAEDVSSGGDPVLGRDELDALLGEGAWDGILQWAFQSMARPLADTHELFA